MTERVKPRTLSLLEQRADALQYELGLKQLFSCPPTGPAKRAWEVQLQIATVFDSQRAWEAMWVRSGRPRHFMRYKSTERRL